MSYINDISDFANEKFINLYNKIETTLVNGERISSSNMKKKYISVKTICNEGNY